MANTVTTLSQAPVKFSVLVTTSPENLPGLIRDCFILCILERLLHWVKQILISFRFSCAGELIVLAALAAHGTAVCAFGGWNRQCLDWWMVGLMKCPERNVE